MLDELLGRAELKDHIEELEEERDSLQNRLDAEQRRRSEAASARQEAEERVNRLEDRIADLEGKVGDDDEPGGDLDFRRVERCHGERTDAVLARLASVETGPEGALTAHVPGERDLPDAVVDLFGDRTAVVRRAAPCTVVADDAGLVSAALAPPVRATGDPAVTWADGFALDRERFLPTGRFAFALVRSDLFALGHYDGRERRSVSGFVSDVKGDHSKGGFSQGRFERIRDEQIDDHLDRCREALRNRDHDRLYLTGDRGVLSDLAADLDPTGTRATDATGEPREALDEAFHDFWETTVYGI